MTRVAERKVALRVERVLRDREETQLNSPADVVAGFFRDYTLHSDAAVLHTRFLRDLYMSSESGSCFEEALHAAALKSRANQLGHKQMATEADVTYGRALTLLNSALQDPLEAKKDATLAASYVVGLSEVCSEPNRVSVDG